MNRSFFVFLLLLPLFTSSAQQTVSDLDFLLGKYDYRTASNFVKVDKNYAAKSIYLNEVVYAAFKEMHLQAKQEGVELKIVSGTRNFNEQKAIWERKWRALDNMVSLAKVNLILEYSSMPATSRHHWGTDIDINNLENSYFEEGRGRAEYEWLVKNAPKFGFYQVYTAQDSGRTGYREEKWHWSYMPLAAKYLQNFNELVDYCEITGFEGSELAEEAGMIPNYVNGIHRELHSPLPLSILPKGIVYLQDEE
ncbi:M15 family metallopeptidase [Salinimicrobium xinjiangense]|uniref:M15 family metallopeptidase n=1 Tax=Salinimicrobium xinjiangense TaxID=438596 RepID=UPI0004147B9F|nr:M15 family metallopeptidase [Salinimicrobium xinjiangense]